MPKNTTINSHTYLQILQNKLPTFLPITNSCYFQHDGAPCHRGRNVIKWLNDEHIQTIGPWPGNSPDLNIIENCWCILKRKVSTLNCSSLTSLKAAITQIWCSEITEEYCEKLADSMPDRLETVLRNNGKHTKY